MHSDRDEAYSSFSASESDGADGAHAASSSFWLPHMGSAADMHSWDQPHPEAGEGMYRVLCLYLVRLLT